MAEPQQNRSENSKKEKSQEGKKQDKHGKHDFPNPKEMFKPEYVYGESNYHELIDRIKRYTGYIAKRITSHQLRNIFNKVKKVKQPEELWKMEVQLAYLAGRNEANKDFRIFVDVLTNLIRNANSLERLSKFQEFLTAIVAYHKYNEKLP
ncbi:MAG: type III-A CRISPR-associated protein Csm2 [Chloroherpetonaceae bacterium]|nr:type III-A CRISPR-associated protein Csm2 [Chloroherpetonaceae bacterium]